MSSARKADLGTIAFYRPSGLPQRALARHDPEAKPPTDGGFLPLVEMLPLMSAYGSIYAECCRLDHIYGSPDCGGPLDPRIDRATRDRAVRLGATYSACLVRQSSESSCLGVLNHCRKLMSTPRAACRLGNERK
jgi:hypothetical protein